MFTIIMSISIIVTSMHYYKSRKYHRIGLFGLLYYVTYIFRTFTVDIRLLYEVLYWVDCAATIAIVVCTIRAFKEEPDIA